MNAQYFFDEAVRIWSPINVPGTDPLRIIPLCTPVYNHPPVLVIGTNHSVFTPGVNLENDNIGNFMAQGVPTINTFTEHNHTFSSGLRASCEAAEIVVLDWVGTNRCSVQTGTKGIGALRKRSSFRRCQREMDTLLKTFVLAICPDKVILAGGFAIKLYYPNVTGRIENLECKYLTPDKLGHRIKLIPILHPSMNYHKARVTHKLINCF